MFNETLKWSVFVAVVVVVSGGDGCGVSGSTDSEGQGGEIRSRSGDEKTAGDGQGWGISGGRRQKVGRKEG